MKFLRFAALALAGALSLMPSVAYSQARVVATCGTLASPLPVNSSGQAIYIDTTGTLCTAGSGGGAVTQSGTWTVQPGNTANTTPWLVTPTPSAASGAAASSTVTAAIAANLVVKGSAGNLYGFAVSADSTLSAAAWWIMIYDATAAPSDGAVTPARCYAMPAGATSYAGAWPTPISFATGITVGVSTTGCFSKTASTHAFISGSFK